MADSYDLIIVGSGPAATMFRAAWLDLTPQGRALIVERGPHWSHAKIVEQRHQLRRKGDQTYTRADDKPWWYGPFLGGTSNLWYGNTPRMLPEDFQLKSRYGVGQDWPVSYDELEPFYTKAELRMGVAGPSDRSPFPRSAPYPLPAHGLSNVEELLAKAAPDDFFVCPTVRASQPFGKRPACCASHVCNQCPVDAKFTVLNTLGTVLDHPRVTLKTGAAVQEVLVEGGVAKGVRWEGGRRQGTAKGDLVALGANALFNPHILLRSGLNGPAVGRYLHEQLGVSGSALLDGLDLKPGTTSCTGHHYRLARGELRRERAAMLLETFSVPLLRTTPGKWLQKLRFTALVETIPDERSRVVVDEDDPRKPKTTYREPGEYTKKTVKRLKSDLQELLAPLPLDRINVHRPRPTEGHIMGSTRMGRDPDSSVVDAKLVHHQVRNLVVLGGSTFPTGAPANPTLTLSTLSLWAAHHLFSSQHEEGGAP